MFEEIVTRLSEKFDPTSASTLKPDDNVTGDQDLAEEAAFRQLLPDGIDLHVTLRGHQDTIQRMSWSPEGNRLASPDNTGVVRTWSVEDGRCEYILKGHSGRVWETAFSSDGRRLLTHGIESGSSGKILAWDTDSGAFLKVLRTRSGGFGFCGSTNQYASTLRKFMSTRYSDTDYLNNCLLSALIHSV